MNLDDETWDTGTRTNISGLNSCVGSGRGNTQTIINAVGVGIYTANMCFNLSLNGYNDWFLPNFIKFDKCSDVLSTSGTFTPIILPYGIYWTSNQGGTNPTNNG